LYKNSYKYDTISKTLKFVAFPASEFISDCSKSVSSSLII